MGLDCLCFFSGRREIQQSHVLLLSALFAVFLPEVLHISEGGKGMAWHGRNDIVPW
jgi:hypothetical protein